MYIPPAHAETDLEMLFAFIESNPFGALVTLSADGEFVATHVPWVLHRNVGDRGSLRGHIARANSQHELETLHGPDARPRGLILFLGPDAYISPSWYASKAQHGKVVPTWNYVAVHVSGRVQFTDDHEFLTGHLEQLVTRHEAGRLVPWSIADAPREYIARQMHGIVGVEVVIERIEGKWKMSQNRSAEDIHGVIEGLKDSPNPQDHRVANVMSARRQH